MLDLGEQWPHLEVSRGGREGGGVSGRCYSCTLFALLHYMIARFAPAWSRTTGASLSSCLSVDVQGEKYAGNSSRVFRQFALWFSTFFGIGGAASDVRGEGKWEEKSEIECRSQ